ncbi:MAG TPA: cupin domain-containing protein [Bryobacteraceae bacterium]|jgi:quercetin dioxygenase-like cupin family protein
MSYLRNEILKRSPRVLGILASLIVPAGIMVCAQQPEGSNFTGKATRGPVPQVRAARIHFEAGARTKWHAHERGQILLCEEGLARTQVKGQPVRELHPGETTYVPGGVPHWHGAAPDRATTLFSIDVSNGQTKWLGEVSEKEYQAKAVR